MNVAASKLVDMCHQQTRVVIELLVLRAAIEWAEWDVGPYLGWRRPEIV